jgi:conjugal transfer pilus assembly protein TraW
VTWLDIRREALVFLAFGMLSAAPMASAKDYGTMGSTWAIAEPDLLAVIRARLLAAQKSGALIAMNQKFVEAAQASVHRPHAVAGITPASVDRHWSFDPSVTIAEDIRDARGNLIAAKGQKFNPLRVVGMAHAFAFVDGDNTRELAWAMKQGAPDKLWIVLVNGSPTDRMKELQRRFYFDQQGVLTSRFGIEHTPALLTQKGETLEIREVALAHAGGLQ